MTSTGKTINRTGDYLPSGISSKTLVECISFSGPTAGIELSPKIPAGSIVIASELRLPVPISATTAVRVGLGTPSDPDKYAISVGLAAQHIGPSFENQWSNPLTAEETIGVYACDNSGAAAGTIGGNGQQVFVRISYLTAETLLEEL